MKVVPPWGLDNYYREVRAVVLDLEKAFLAGTLESRLEHADVREVGGSILYKVYERLLVADPRRHYDLRLDAVRALLEQVRVDLFAVDIHGSATIHALGTARHGMPELRPVILATIQGRQAHLRLDQFLAARSWGIGFDFDQLDANEAFTSFVAHNSVIKLAYDLQSLQRIIAKFEPRYEQEPSLCMVPHPEERGFERLMLDILNEHEPIAWFAQPHEDFLHKTDLRIESGEFPERGVANIQVTQIADPNRYQKKLSNIRSPEQLVMLSPPSLAVFLVQQMKVEDSGRVLSKEDRSAVWACIDDRPATTDELATSIKHILIRALQLPKTDPRGPMANVPSPVRNLIRAFVRQDASRALRATGAATAGKVDSYVTRNWTATMVIQKRIRKLLERIAQQAGVNHYMSGQTLTGVVTKIVDYGLFVRLGEATGLLHVSKTPHPPGTLGAHFVVGQEIAVAIDYVDQENSRIALTVPPLADRAPLLLGETANDIKY